MKTRVCIIGLGRVGLPLACLLANAGYSVHGVDIDAHVIACVQSASLVELELNLHDLLRQAVQSGHLTASSSVEPADIHIIAVPTLLTSNNAPDISHVYAAVDAIKLHLRPHDLVLIESTCPVGTTEAIAQKLHMTGLSVKVAYCPERVLPGNILHELIHNDRVVGGINDTSTIHAVKFYESFVRGDVVATNARTAEAVKLAENAYRDVNIAYANELSMIADRLELDVHEVIRLANKHPRVQILNPGSGVGGYCIAMDPWYLVSAAPDLAVLTSKAREINNQKAQWVIQKIRNAIKENRANVVACLGLTYKSNVSDIRESPALAVVQALEKEIEVLRVDPYIPNTHMLSHALARADIVVGLVAHHAFLNISPHDLKGKIMLDFAGLIQ